MSNMIIVASVVLIAGAILGFIIGYVRGWSDASEEYKKMGRSTRSKSTTPKMAAGKRLRAKP